MIPMDDALSIVVAQTHELENETVSIENAHGRVLAEDVESDTDLPPFDKSAVDGYALRSSDAAAVNATFRVKASLSAGKVYGGVIGKGECIKIMTGTPMPEGADAVVMVEDTEPVRGGGAVVVKRTAKPGGNVCSRGEDTRKGEKVLTKGSLLLAPEIAILASVGKSGLRVVRRPEIGILSTGNEIVEPGFPLEPGQIRNSNGPMLVALSRAAGCAVDYLGISGDNREDLRRAVRRGARKDVLLISGGVSMGDYDFVPQVLGEEGAEIFFHKVRMKPGKPLLFAKMGKCLVFGIPGNPVSTFVVFYLFIHPAIVKMAGRGSGLLDVTKAVIECEFRIRSDRVHMVPARYRMNDGRVLVTPFTLNGSADIAACARCNSLILFESGTYMVKEGNEVTILPLPE